MALTKEVMKIRDEMKYGVCEMKQENATENWNDQELSLLKVETEGWLLTVDDWEMK